MSLSAIQVGDYSSGNIINAVGKTGYGGNGGAGGLGGYYLNSKTKRHTPGVNGRNGSTSYAAPLVTRSTLRQSHLTQRSNNSLASLLGNEYYSNTIFYNNLAG